MSDWVTTALVGLGNDQQQSEDLAGVFRFIRSAPEPDALQVFLGVIAEMGKQAEAEIAAGVAAGLERLLEKRPPYSDACMAAILEVEERFSDEDVELVSIEHLAKWDDINEKLKSELAAGLADGDKLAALLREVNHVLLEGRVDAGGTARWVSLPKRITAALAARAAAAQPQTDSP